MADTLDSQAAAFAQLLKLTGDPDAAFRSAVALADGLFPHQIEGVAFLLGRRRAILADDMGLGKTRQAVVSLRHLTPGGPRLIVCPASVKRNWAREIAVVSADAAVLVIEGTAPAAPAAEWVVINYDILGRHLDALLRVRWQALVFDEAHYLKNHTSARCKLARQLTAAAAAAQPTLAVQLLTGTPLTSRPRDLFVLLQLAAHPLGRSFLAFAKRYCAAEKGEYGWKTGGASNIEELTVQLHGVMLRRSKDQVLALPPKLRTWLPVEVPKGTGVRDMRKVVDLLIGEEKITSSSAIDERVLRGRLLHAVTVARQTLAAAKVKSTIDFVTGAVDVKTPHFLSYSGNVVVSAGHGSVVPYATAGVGGLSLFERAEVGVNDTTTFLTTNVGGGVKWYAGRWGLRGDYRFIAVQSKDDAPAIFGQETRYGHRIYGGVILNVAR